MLGMTWYKVFIAILCFAFIGLTILFEISFKMDISISKVLKTNPFSSNNKSIDFDNRYLDLFLKQLSRAQRFERNEELSDAIGKMVTRLSRINGGYQIQHDPRDNITVIFNAVNEVTDLKVLLEDIKNKPNWTVSTHIQLGLTRSIFDKHSSMIKDIQHILPNFNTTILESKSLVQSLRDLVAKSSTQFVLLTKGIRRFDQNFDMRKFLKPLVKKTCDVISGSVIYPDGRWSSGCYQSKLIWSQYKSVFGFDVCYKHQLLRCDYFDGPFAMDRNVLLDYLTSRVTTKCADDLVYPEILYVMNNQNKIMKSHPASIFYKTDWVDFHDLTRAHLLDFAIRNEISEFYLPAINGTQTHLEFNYIESKVKCNLRATQLRQRACMRDLHFMLVNTYKLFDKLGYQYTNEDGSGLAAAKLHDTIPWDLDQDFAFRASNLTHIVQHESEWRKLGMSFSLELNKPCVKNMSHVKKDNLIMGCGYIGIGNKNWRMELWGSYILLGDFYQPWKIPARAVAKEQEPLRSSRIKGHDTKVRLDDHWAQNRPNPGYYVRGRYGVDMLRHANHWLYGGASGSYGIYKTGSRFVACSNPGFHGCMDQYLADGNIQFQRPWA
uniref:Uncharacterized protein n=1 Tax=Clytia hemisphaerica TaxID=252671 RepID=A0A7M5UZ79_9CNID